MSIGAEKSVQPLKCPVCNAGFRGDETCPRCGSNLRQIMCLAARAWALREMSRSQLFAGDLMKSLQYAEKASRVQGSE